MRELLVILLLGFCAGETVFAQRVGCTDPLARNYDAQAICNDGSCVYPNASVSPSTQYLLPYSINEPSGLAFWDSRLWMHNDNQKNRFYGLLTNGDTNNILIDTVRGLHFTDWEEVVLHDGYVYIGDLGNNAKGNRSRLCIFKIQKESMFSENPVFDSIVFTYSNQTDFTEKTSNKTDFDCEAFVVTRDSIYLFTKQWIQKKTGLYALANQPGKQVAMHKGDFDVHGLITGANYVENKGIVMLCGYSSTMQPFLYLLYEFPMHDFFSGNKRKIGLSMPFHQVEGIVTQDGLSYYIVNEYFHFSGFQFPQRLSELNMEPYLGNYIERITNLRLDTLTAGINRERGVIPELPIGSYVEVDVDTAFLPAEYVVIDSQGTIVSSGMVRKELRMVDISQLPAGEYMVKVGEFSVRVNKFRRN